MLTKEFINPHAMGFTNTVTYTHGGVKTIVISGQVGYADGKVGETFEEQADIAHQNIIRELAAAGLPEAALRLGSLYAAGGPVGLDRVKALAWLLVAERRGLAEAAPLARALEAQLSAEQRRQAEELADLL